MESEQVPPSVAILPDGEEIAPFLINNILKKDYNNYAEDNDLVKIVEYLKDKTLLFTEFKDYGVDEKFDKQLKFLFCNVLPGRVVDGLIDLWKNKHTNPSQGLTKEFVLKHLKGSEAKLRTLKG